MKYNLYLKLKGLDSEVPNKNNPIEAKNMQDVLNNVKLPDFSSMFELEIIEIRIEKFEADDD